MCGHSMCEHSMWARTQKSAKITTKNEHQFLGRMLRNTEKHENYHENLTSVLGPDVAAPKTSKKHEFYCKNPVQEHCRTPKSTRITTKNEHRRSWRAEKVRKFTDETRFYPLKSTADTRKVRELPRKMNMEEVEEPETMKIYRQNPRASARPPRKLRKFRDETNMQARNHENSDEFRPTPLRHLDLNTPAFYYYRKNPKCYHTVWGKISVLPQFWASDTHEVTKGSLGEVTNLRFTTVLSVLRQKFAFYHSFERPTRTKWRNGRSATSKICVLPQFWASDTHEVTRRLSNPQVRSLRPDRKRIYFKTFSEDFD